MVGLFAAFAAAARRKVSMSRYDFRTPRLFVEAPLGAGVVICLDRAQVNYLVNALRLKAGAPVLVFNGRDGEWRAALRQAGRKDMQLVADTQTRAQTLPGDRHYAFAPLKHARLDYMVQKAVELGAARLQPVITRHTQVERVNMERMRANVIEAAEQCGILSLPELSAPLSFDAFVGSHDPARLMVFCDEDAEVADPVAALLAARHDRIEPLCVLVGPEGGFADEERAALATLPRVVRLALGPRILRADTAAVAALAIVQAVLGDWR
jgi:16S rRNA (uracil1498-N3)-methyltransferase